MQALIFDTETTGLIDNHSIPLDKQPYILEFYAAIVDLEAGTLEGECHKIIKPPRALTDFEIKISNKSHKFTTEELADKPSFVEVADDIKTFIEAGPRPLAHNAGFDLEMVEIEFERLGQTIQWGGRPICSIESTIHLKGYRLSLGALHEHLFGEGFKDAHRAKNDSIALIRCASELYKRGEI